VWILKGSFVGLLMFSAGTVAFLSLTVFRPFSTSKATGLSALAAMTTENPFWWTALVCCVVLGCCLVASWPVRAPIAH